jgi:Domain of unknown function (DUF4386)
MSTSTAAAILLVLVPVAFNVAFGLLAARFDYPDILRRPTDEVLGRFHQGGSSLVLLWWSFALSAVLFAPLVILLSHSLDGADAALLSVGATVGVLAATVQFLGLMRWPFLVPYLARVVAEPDATPVRREAVDVVFQSLNRYLGVAVGEHLGYGLTGAWSVLAGAAIMQSTAAPSWLGVIGIIVGGVLMLCSLEFVGRFEPTGWKLAEGLTPVAYIGWSLWLVATGIALVV